jgi:ferri-bacillibactin esterase
MARTTFKFPATDLGTEYHVTLENRPSDELAPLVLVLDGDDQFEAAVEAARESADAKKTPTPALAAIGYGGSYRSPKNRRARDYTPTHPQDEPMETGGAAAFLDVLQRLLPELYSKIGYTPPHLGLTGHSLSSLFGLFALAQPEPLFDRFLLSSPSIWWDNRAVLGAIKATSAHPISGREVRAFLSVGRDDTPSMTGDLEILEELLQTHPRTGLRHVVERFEGKDHETALPTAFRAGFDWLF